MKNWRTWEPASEMDWSLAVERESVIRALRIRAEAVASAKRFKGGSGGGAFVVNEYGQVIVPSSDGGGARGPTISTTSSWLVTSTCTAACRGTRPSGWRSNTAGWRPLRPAVLT